MDLDHFHLTAARRWQREKNERASAIRDGSSSVYICMEYGVGYHGITVSRLWRCLWRRLSGLPVGAYLNFQGHNQRAGGTRTRRALPTPLYFYINTSHSYATTSLNHSIANFLPEPSVLCSGDLSTTSVRHVLWLHRPSF